MGLAIKILLAVTMLLAALCAVLAFMWRKTTAELVNTKRELMMLRAFSKGPVPSPVAEPPSEPLGPQNVPDEGEVSLPRRIEVIDTDQETPVQEEDEPVHKAEAEDDEPVHEPEENDDEPVHEPEDEEAVVAPTMSSRRRKRTRNH